MDANQTIQLYEVARGMSGGDPEKALALFNAWNTATEGVIKATEKPAPTPDIKAGVTEPPKPAPPPTPPRATFAPKPPEHQRGAGAGWTRKETADALVAFLNSRGGSAHRQEVFKHFEGTRTASALQNVVHHSKDRIRTPGDGVWEAVDKSTSFKPKPTTPTIFSDAGTTKRTAVEVLTEYFSGYSMPRQRQEFVFDKLRRCGYSEHELLKAVETDPGLDWCIRWEETQGRAEKWLGTKPAIKDMRLSEERQNAISKAPAKQIEDALRRSPGGLSKTALFGMVDCNRAAAEGALNYLIQARRVSSLRAQGKYPRYFWAGDRTTPTAAKPYTAPPPKMSDADLTKAVREALTEKPLASRTALAKGIQGRTQDEIHKHVLMLIDKGHIEDRGIRYGSRLVWTHGMTTEQVRSLNEELAVTWLTSLLPTKGPMTEDDLYRKIKPEGQDGAAVDRVLGELFEEFGQDGTIWFGTREQIAELRKTPPRTGSASTEKDVPVLVAGLVKYVEMHTGGTIRPKRLRTSRELLRRSKVNTGWTDWTPQRLDRGVDRLVSLGYVTVLSSNVLEINVATLTFHS